MSAPRKPRPCMPCDVCGAPTTRKARSRDHYVTCGAVACSAMPCPGECGRMVLRAGRPGIAVANRCVFCNTYQELEAACIAEGVDDARELQGVLEFDIMHRASPELIMIDVRRAIEACFPDRAGLILGRIRVTTTRRF